MFSGIIIINTQNIQPISPETSDDAHQHQVPSFSHIMQWMVTLPIFSESAMKEAKHILDAARLNEYTNWTISSLASRHTSTLQQQALMKLTPGQQFKRK